MARIPDDEILFEMVPKTGDPIGNLSLLRALEDRGWNAEKYWRVRDRLLAEGRLVRGRGKGGSVRRAAAEPFTPTTPPLPSSQTEKSAESELYGPVLKVLELEWARDMGIEADEIYFEETAQQGRKDTGGTWTRPDVTAVSVRSFPHLPNKYFDIWTFEIKPAQQLDITGVFEAAAHAARATRSYALLQTPESPDSRTRSILERCEREAVRLGVGLITFAQASNFETWETLVDAPRIDTRPELLEEFISQLSEDAKKRLTRWK